MSVHDNLQNNANCHRLKNNHICEACCCF